MTPFVGLTGGIATGKSSVSKLLAELGAWVIDADAITRELQAPGTPLLAELVDAFGKSILASDGSLDRESLGQLVFADPAARGRINQLVHPKVGAELWRRAHAARQANAPMAILDIPLLLEGRAARSNKVQPFDWIVLVYTPESVQLERLMQRDGRDRESALQRIRSQLSIEEKRELADIVIDNSGSWQATSEQVRAVYNRIIQSSHS